jgi:type II secretory pathway pseudopilin PulG
LIELLVAMAVMALVLVLALQVVTNTGAAIKMADNQRGAGTAARVALDRFASDFSTAMLTGGASAIVSTNASGSFIRFICLSRARDDGTSAIPRGAIVGYGINPITERIGGQDVTYDTLQRGDGRVDFSGSGSSLSGIFSALSQSPPAGVIPDANWAPVGSGIVRFHISYVLDDGRIVQTAPAYEMISPQTDARVGFLNGLALGAGFEAVAFAPENAPATGALAGRHVKSVLVAVAALEPKALATASSAQLDEIHSKLGTPDDGQTPLAVWQSNLGRITFPPLLQGIRFYQRTIPVP